MSEPSEAERSIVHESVASSKDRRGRLLISLAVAAMLIFTGVSAIAGYIAYTTVQDAAQRGTTLAQQVQEACADPTVDEAELGTLCSNADDVVDDAPEAAKGPKGDTGETGATGDQGLPGEAGPPPSAAQVANAVASYCANGRCDGEDGTDGRDGRNVTASQVASAVALYCNDRGQCRGPEGPSGSAGQDGTDGTDGADGKPGEKGDVGPPPSDGQVISAVAAYCSEHNNCQGPAGQEGATGPKGDTGDTGATGQAGIDGTSAVPFTFTFTIPAEPPLQTERSYSCTVTAPSTTANCTPI